MARAVAATEPADRARYFSSASDALAWWPDPAGELRGDAVVTGPSLTDAFDATKVAAESARIGLGPSGGVGQGKLAWWAGTLEVTARQESGDGAVHEVPVRVRATFVLQYQTDRWMIVQSHVSAPIDDARLAREIAGDATMVGGHLVVPCDAARPAAARRRRPARGADDRRGYGAGCGWPGSGSWKPVTWGSLR